MNYDGPALADALHRAHHRTARDEALLRQALEASQALIDRWDSPDWKDLPHTGTYILQLRKVAVALEQRLGERG